ncbi:FG-GAP repeat domain-containing protein [Nocardia sp. NPDC088792]|uniref:FG-GAP repeat domain-containing protein n=1 Tax=Nocardia sp. NPDC088792 TaxID=3364332 RepID=UPI0037FC9805
MTVCGVSPTAEAIAHGDFTGDGQVDLVVTDECGFGIQFLHGRGDGTFDPPRYLFTGIAPDAVTAADFDGDGNLDVAVASGFAVVVNVLYGDGHGGIPKQRSKDPGRTRRYSAGGRRRRSPGEYVQRR